MVRLSPDTTRASEVRHQRDHSGLCPKCIDERRFALAERSAIQRTNAS